jgi:Prenyltransferase and squalene oxidase repeat
MMQRLTAAVLVLAVVGAAPAADDAAFLRYKTHVDRGLEWLAKHQERDGCWSGDRGIYPLPLTSLAGMALLGEGSTPSQGKYAPQLDRAVRFVVGQAQPNGLIGDPQNPDTAGRYLFGHAFGTLFLSEVYALEGPERRKQLQPVLDAAIKYSAEAQTSRGGWGYVSAADGNDFDEGCVTAAQVQALYAARQAGIVVPKELLAKTHDYLRKSNKVVRDDVNFRKREAGVLYSLLANVGDARPALTAAEAASLLHGGREQEELVLPWVNYCRTAIPAGAGPGGGLWQYNHYYFAQVIYQLGEDGYARMRPDLATAEVVDPDKPMLLKWSRYREATFPYLISKQQEDGSWKDGYVGPVFSTSLYLTILQLDRENVPFYRGCKRGIE